MKAVLYIIHVPMFIVGAILATIWFGFVGGFAICMDFWVD